MAFMENKPCPITGHIAGCDGEYHRDDCWDEQFNRAVEMMLEGARLIEKINLARSH